MFATQCLCFVKSVGKHILGIIWAYPNWNHSPGFGANIFFPNQRWFAPCFLVSRHMSKVPFNCIWFIGVFSRKSFQTSKNVSLSAGHQRRPFWLSTRFTKKNTRGNSNTIVNGWKLEHMQGASQTEFCSAPAAPSILLSKNVWFQIQTWPSIQHSHLACQRFFSTMGSTGWVQIKDVLARYAPPFSGWRHNVLWVSLLQEKIGELCSDVPVNMHGIIKQYWARRKLSGTEWCYVLF